MRTAPPIFSFVLAAALAAQLPAQEKAAAGAVPKVTYDDQVTALLREKCFACHNAEKEKGGLNLQTYQKAMAGGSSGAVIEPGDADGSRLYLLVSHQKEPHMPPRSQKLPPEQLEVIRQWIAGGALENAGSKPRAPKRPALALASQGAGQKPEGPPPLPLGLSIEPVVRTARPGSLTALDASPWAPLLALAGQKEILLYHSETLELLGVLPFPEGLPHVVRFSRNGKLLLAGGGRGAKSGRVAVFSVETGERVAEVGEELDLVLAADLSADHSQVALGGPSKMVRIYSTADGQLLHQVKKHTDWITALEFSPDGALLASGDRAGGLYVWEAETGREFSTLKGHKAGVTSVSWRSDSNLLASADEEAKVRIWEMENGAQVRRWVAHGSGVLCVHFARDGRIVTAGRDRLVKLWDQEGKELKSFEPFNDLALRAVLTGDGSRVAAGDWTGEVRVWLASDGKRLGSLLLNPPTIAERLSSATSALEPVRAREAELAAAWAASRAAAEKGGAEVAAAKKSAEEAARGAAAAAEEAAKAKESADRAQAALAQGLADLGAKETAARAVLTGKDAQASAKAQGDLDLAQKRAGELPRAVEAAVGEWVARQKAAGKAAAEAEAARKAQSAVEAPIKSASEKAAADKAALDQARGAVASAEALVEKWTRAGKLDLARKELAARAAKQAPLAAAAAESAAIAEKLGKELAEAREALKAANAALTAATPQLAKSKAGADEALKALSSALADKDGPGNAAREASKAIEPRVSEWLAAQEAHRKASADLASAEAKVKTLEPQARAAAERAASDKAAADPGASALAGARAELEKLVKGAAGKP